MGNVWSKHSSRIFPTLFLLSDMAGEMQKSASFVSTRTGVTEDNQPLMRSVVSMGGHRYTGDDEEGRFMWWGGGGGGHGWLDWRWWFDLIAFTGDVGKLIWGDIATLRLTMKVGSCWGDMATLGMLIMTQHTLYRHMSWFKIYFCPVSSGTLRVTPRHTHKHVNTHTHTHTHRHTHTHNTH